MKNIDLLAQPYQVTDIDKKLLKASIAAYGVYGCLWDAQDKKFDSYSTWETLKEYGGNPVGFTKGTVYVSGRAGINACYLAETENEIILTFRATATTSADGLAAGILDWFLSDFKANPVTDSEFGEGQVHKGFRDAVSSLMRCHGRISEAHVVLETTLLDDIIHAVNASPKKKFHIVGYSKGSGLAPLAAMYLMNNAKNKESRIKASRIESVHIFEAPRCGNEQFRAHYNWILGDVTKRFEYQYDIVPHLPPMKISLKYLKQVDEKLYNELNLFYLGELNEWHYQSVGNLIHINVKNDITQYPEYWADLRFEMENFGNLGELSKSDGSFKKALGEVIQKYHVPYGINSDGKAYGIASVICHGEEWPFPLK